MTSSVARCVLGYPLINVEDTNGEAWSANAAAEAWNYTRDFTCPTDTSLYVGGVREMPDHVNTATIVETGQSGDATVEVTCYAPVVAKTASTYFNRDWDWTILKEFDGDYSIFAGDLVVHDYTVSVDPTFTDNFWGVMGDITVYNRSYGRLPGAQCTRRREPGVRLQRVVARCGHSDEHRHGHAGKRHEFRWLDHCGLWRDHQ